MICQGRQQHLMYPSKDSNLIVIELGIVQMTFLSNYHHRLLMGFSKVIVINMNIIGMNSAC